MRNSFSDLALADSARIAFIARSKGYILCVLFSLVPGFPVDLLAILCGMLKTKPLLFFTLSWTTLTIQFALCAWLGNLIIQWLL